VLKIEIARLADADIVDMLEYGADMFGWGRAEAYVQGFSASFALIAEFPEIGFFHTEFRPPIRSFPHGSHRIFYDVEADRIVIQRILHKSRDAQVLLS
jgi:toxin ParE1/3/4